MKEITVYRLVTLCLFFLVTGQVNAALIGVERNGTYFTDTQSHLDWRSLSVSEGMTYSQVTNELSQGGLFEGWRLASANEFGSMYANITGADCDINGPDQSCYDFSTEAEYFRGTELVMSEVLELFLGADYQSYNVCGNLDACLEGQMYYIQGFLSDSNPAYPDLEYANYGTFEYINANKYIRTPDGRDIGPYGTLYSTTHTLFYADKYSNPVGSAFLVRDSVSVHEPVSLGLLAIGLAAVGFLRRKNANLKN